MSVENFDGDGFADQPSIIYGYTDDQDELHIKELSRSGYGEPGPSPGDIIDRDSTKSTLDTKLPAQSLPAQDGLIYDDCGKDIPAFGCTECGSPVYVGRTCANPLCSRGWASAVKSKAIRAAGKCWAMQQILNSRHHEDIDHNHVVASMPDFVVDSDDPIDRAIEVLKTLLKEYWGIENFVAIYHPYRIKKEYRKDQYEHGGEPGEGDMTWKDVYDTENPDEYIYHSPHFHLFFPAKRRQFDYSVVEYVNTHSGWSFHRITKGGPESDNNTSVKNLADLVHQMTYCFSHAGVRVLPSRNELTSRLKGEIHNLYVPDDITDQITASFCDAAPKLLGVKFANLSNATCDADISDADPDTTKEEHGAAESADRDEDHPLYDVFEPGITVGSSSRTNGNPWGSELDPVAGDRETDSSGNDGVSASVAFGSASDDETTTATPDSQEESTTETDSPLVDDRTDCGGDLVPIWEARDLLNDADWCSQAAHVAGLRTAVEEWERLTDGEEEYPWADRERDDGDDDIDTTQVLRDPG